MYEIFKIDTFWFLASLFRTSFYINVTIRPVEMREMERFEREKSDIMSV